MEPIKIDREEILQDLRTFYSSAKEIENMVQERFADNGVYFKHKHLEEFVLSIYDYDEEGRIECEVRAYTESNGDDDRRRLREIGVKCWGPSPQPLAEYYFKPEEVWG